MVADRGDYGQRNNMIRTQGDSNCLSRVETEPTRAPWGRATGSVSTLLSPFQSWFKEVTLSHRNLLGDSVGTGVVAKTTATVRIDEQGRCYIPKPAREKLGIDGEAVNAEITVEYDE